MDIQKKRKQTVRKLGRIFGWLGLVFLLFTLLTGYGIAEYRIVTPLTFNLMNKAVAQRLHAYTEVPMILLLLVHIGIAVWPRPTESKQKED